jgi:hypothetical protein
MHIVLAMVKKTEKYPLILELEIFGSPDSWATSELDWRKLLQPRSKTPPLPILVTGFWISLVSDTSAAPQCKVNPLPASREWIHYPLSITNFCSYSVLNHTNMDHWQAPDSLNDYSFFFDDSLDIFGNVDFDANPLDQLLYATTAPLSPTSWPCFLGDSLTPPFPAEALLGNDEIDPNSLQTIGDCPEPLEQHLRSQATSIPSRDLSNLLKVDQQARFYTLHKEGLLEVEKPKPKKTKWDKSVVVFSSKPNSTKAPRQRKSFGKSRREEVALTRKIGACIQCRIRKGSVKHNLLLNLKVFWLILG